MEEPVCFKCLRDSSQVKLLDAIDREEIIKICEECAVTEDIPIIRKPSSFQLRTETKPATVYNRMIKMAGLPQKQDEQDKVKNIASGLTIPHIENEEQLSIRQRQEIAKQLNQPLNLINNFHWHIQMSRRRKKITSSQLSQAIGESEELIKMIEQGQLPDDVNKIIRKIEQYLGINLEKTKFEAEQNRIKSIKQPSRVINFNQESLKEITISDLMNMKKAQEENKEEIKEPPKPSESDQDQELLGEDIELIEE